ncbi:MAG: hypothetical protein GY847_38235 [Proteobacteria bacterium]|nr:hypothetical protein [Pseudomonadota bacterium]
MARILIAAILISFVVSTHCGGECIRHSDCPNGLTCSAGACANKGEGSDEDAGSSSDEDAGSSSDSGTTTGDGGQDESTDSDSYTDSDGGADIPDSGQDDSSDSGTI